MATQVWAWQGGTSTYDTFNAVAMGSDGSSVSAGFTNGTEGGSTTLGKAWAAVRLDADGKLVWEWDMGFPCCDYYEIEGAVMDNNGSIVFAGSDGSDFHVIKLDADGTLVWQLESGFGTSHLPQAIAIGDDGSVVVAGLTYGEWNISNLGSGDMAAFKMDADGTLVWKWQGGTANMDWAYDVAMAEDGSVVMAGYSDGDFMGVGARVSSSSFSSADWGRFAAIKLDPEGEEVWRWQDGVGGEFDTLRAVSVTEDGSFVMVGHTEGVWSGVVSAGGYDFAAVKLDADGNEVWRWQDGTVENDFLYDLAVQDDGTIVLGGRTDGDWSGSNAGDADVAVVALDADGEVIWRWQGGTAESGNETGYDTVLAMAAGPDGRIILAGTTSGSWEETNLGQGDYMVVVLDTGALATPSPTAAPVPVVASTPAPATATPPPSSAAAPTTPAPTPAPTTAPTRPTPQPFTTLAPSPAAITAITPDPTPAPSNSTPIVAGVASAVAVAALIALGLCLRKRHITNKNNLSGQVPLPVFGVDVGNGPPPPKLNPSPPPPSYSAMMAVAKGDRNRGDGGTDLPFPEVIAGVVPLAAEPTTGGRHNGVDRGVPLAQGDTNPTAQAEHDDGGDVSLAREDALIGSVESALTVTSSTANISTGERDELNPQYTGGGAVAAVFVADESKPTSDEIGASSSSGRRQSSDGLGLGQAVEEAALELAHNCHIPGVSEAAAAVSILANLATNNRDNVRVAEASLKRCRTIVIMLQRGAKVLGKGGETHGMAERVMMEDVHDAISDLVELVQTYQSKNRLSQVLMSTLFKRRQDEMGAVVDRAISGLQLGLQVQVGTDVSAVKQDVNAFTEGMRLYQGSIEEAQSKCLTEARRVRRQRKLDQIEIPDDHVAITDELLGKGGFGEVYLADYNGRNAAAKVMLISHDLVGVRGENDVLDVSAGCQLQSQREKSQRKAFLSELHAMIRLRSPYTVNVYGAVTTIPDRLILVMELLAGGDLRALLKNFEESLPEEKSRQIVGDICAGMAFLHSKEAVHGDLKSANVLLDGAGRAKIGDFGTSRWMQHTMSTGLATFTTKCSKNTQMSLPWSAPEVLDAAEPTYASDVYSFGIVVWEVLSRELPWATEARPTYILVRVLKGQRPVIPDNAPAEIADVARACWAGLPGDRPTFSAILEGMKSNGWNE